MAKKRAKTKAEKPRELLLFKQDGKWRLKQSHFWEGYAETADVIERVLKDTGIPFAHERGSSLWELAIGPIAFAAKLQKLKTRLAHGLSSSVTLRVHAVEKSAERKAAPKLIESIRSARKLRVAPVDQLPGPFARPAKRKNPTLTRELARARKEYNALMDRADLKLKMIGWLEDALELA